MSYTASLRMHTLHCPSTRQPATASQGRAGTHLTLNTPVLDQRASVGLPPVDEPLIGPRCQERCSG